MALATDLPTNKTPAATGHTTGHNTTNNRINLIAAAVNDHVGDVSDLGYDVVLLMGQSNMQGAGTIDTSIDVTNPRVWAYPSTGADADTIVQAADPLGHLNPVTSGVGPGMSFGHWYAGTAPGTRRVLLVPCASAGAGFSAGSGAGRWDPTYVDLDENLYERTITQAAAAVTAAGSTARLIGALWVQGEADASIAAGGYRQYLEWVIDGLRDRLDEPQLPFVIGSMLPESASGGTIDGVHAGTPNRKAYTAFVDMPTGYNSGDDIHYNAAGARELGRRLVAGLATARLNTAPAGLVAPSLPPTPGLTTNRTYTFATSADLTNWYDPDAQLTVSSGNLVCPATAAYATFAPAVTVDLTDQSVTWIVAGNLSGATTSADTFLGVCLNAANASNALGVQFDYSATPWTQARTRVSNSNTGYSGANRALGWYRVSTATTDVVIEYSTNGTSWTELHRETAPFTVTAVRPFIQLGHFTGAEPDGNVLVAELRIA